MKRLLLLGGLLVANLIAFGVWSGWLDPWLPGGAEPQRLASQVAPERIKVVPATTPDAGRPAVPGGAAAPAGEGRADSAAPAPANGAVANGVGGAASAPAITAPTPSPSTSPVATAGSPAATAPVPAVPAPAAPKPAATAAPTVPAASASSPAAAAPAAAAPTVPAPTAAAAAGKGPPVVVATPPAGASAPAVVASKKDPPAAPAPAPAPAAAVPPAPPAPRETTVASLVCVQAGPLDEARAERARAWSRKLAAGLQGKVDRRVEGTSYMVYVPPSRTQADAQRRFDQLRQSGQTDLFLITEGSLKLAISLGIFRTQEAARAQIESLGTRGIDNLRIASIPGRSDRVWATLTRTASVADGPWDAARAQLKEISGVTPSVCAP